jgi:TolA-binding protein
MLQLYPDSSYTGEALWWMAEAFYRLKQFDQAAVVYGSLVRDYPDSKRIKAARERLTELGSRPGAASVPPPLP